MAEDAALGVVGARADGGVEEMGAAGTTGAAGDVGAEAAGTGVAPDGTRVVDTVSATPGTLTRYARRAAVFTPASGVAVTGGGVGDAAEGTSIGGEGTVGADIETGVMGTEAAGGASNAGWSDMAKGFLPVRTSSSSYSVLRFARVSTSCASVR